MSSLSLGLVANLAEVFLCLQGNISRTAVIQIMDWTVVAIVGIFGIAAVAIVLWGSDS